MPVCVCVCVCVCVIEGEERQGKGVFAREREQIVERACGNTVTER